MPITMPSESHVLYVCMYDSILDLTAELKDLNYQKVELKRRHDEAQAKVT